MTPAAILQHHNPVFLTDVEKEDDEETHWQSVTMFQVTSSALCSAVKFRTVQCAVQYSAFSIFQGVHVVEEGVNLTINLGNFQPSCFYWYSCFSAT